MGWKKIKKGNQDWGQRVSSEKTTAREDYSLASMGESTPCKGNRESEKRNPTLKTRRKKARLNQECGWEGTMQATKSNVEGAILEETVGHWGNVKTRNNRPLDP